MAVGGWRAGGERVSDLSSPTLTRHGWRLIQIKPSAFTQDEAGRPRCSHHARMAVTDTLDFAEWRTRIAHALRRSSDAAASYVPASEIRKLEQRVRALEQEGRTRGFLPADGACG